MKRRLRTKVWWQVLDKGAEEVCKKSHPCQVVGAPTSSDPWHLATDLMTPSLPSGDHVFAVVDYYSRYIEIQVMKSTTTDKKITSLKRMFRIAQIKKKDWKEEIGAYLQDHVWSQATNLFTWNCRVYDRGSRS